MLDVGRLYSWIAILLFMLAFGQGALQWASFGRQSGIPNGLFTQTDFPAVTIASRLIAAGEGAQLYDLGAQLRGQRRLIEQGYVQLSSGDPKLYYPYPYTPFLALLYAPFAAAGPLAAMASWDLMNLAAFAAALWALLRELPLAGAARPLLALGALTSLPWIVNLEQGQSSGPVALGMALGVALLRRGRDLPAGVALGLLFLKVQWLPLIVLVLLVKGRWRALLGLAITGVALVGAATLALGPAWLPAYGGVLTSASRSGEAFLLTPAASHSLNGGIYALLGPGSVALVGPLNLLASLLIVGFLLWAWLRPASRPGDSNMKWRTWQPGTPTWDALMGLTLLAAILTNLQLNTHDLSLLVIPAALGFSSLSRRREAQAGRVTLAWHACLWLLYFTPLLLLGPLLDPDRPLPIRLTTWLMALMLALLGAMMTDDGRRD